MKRPALESAGLGLAIALAGVLPAVPAAAQTTLKVGLSSPLSGAQAPYGQDNANGARLAVQELNAKKLQVGGKPLAFELLAEDDQADPRQGVAVAQKMVDSGVRFVLGPYNSGVTLPASKVYEDGGAVVMTVSSNPKITEQGYKGLFRVGANDSQLGAKMAEYAGKEMKLKRVAVIDDRTSYGQGVAEQFVKQAKALGMEVAGHEYTTDKATDFTSILTKLKGSKPEAIFFGGYSSQAGPMARQMTALGIDAKLLGGDGICSSETAKLAGGDAAAQRVWCTQGGTRLDKAGDAQGFLARYKAAYGRDPLTYAASFYDAMNLLADTIQKTQSTDAKKVAAALASGSYKGVAGVYAFDDKHDLKSSPVTVFNLKGGQPEAIAGY